MNIGQIFKRRIIQLLQSSQKIAQYKDIYIGKKVLLVGDGISSVYVKDIIHEYDYIIACNNSIQNKQLANSNIIFYIIMEPDLLYRSRFKEVRQNFQKGIEKFGKTVPVMNPLGRVPIFFKKQFPDPVYISPYMKLDSKHEIVYDNFTAAFQATLGLALLCGFSEIDCIGFDAWLLTPKNNLRWYSKSLKPETQDTEAIAEPEDFLLKAAGLAKLRVVTFGHYRSRLVFIEEIRIPEQPKAYVPTYDREEYMYDYFKDYVLSWEAKNYPGENGYGKKEEQQQN
jgi:hypothetical protein